ncbi:MAG: transposase [Alphaproteobacteria bacterium]
MLQWEDPLDAVGDTRPRPQIPTSVVLRAMVVMFLNRLGSLNALEQTRASRCWQRWLPGALPSADTLGRVCALVEPSDVRALQRHVYTRLKRMKALVPPAHGLMGAAIDGHESHATYRRCCAGCLERTIHTAQGDRTQYYHRHVALQLIGRDFHVLLDAEPQCPGEDEVATALRLLDRVLDSYPRAFDVVLADALYADSRMFNYGLKRGKDIIAVLKDDRRDLMQDAESLFEQTPPVRIEDARGSRETWDLEGFTSWPQVTRPVRVVRSLERRSIRRQLDQQAEPLTSDWTWVTTLSKPRASTDAVIALGHSRWDIENQGFNEMATRWHADHVYKHHPTALLVLWLVAMICLTVFGVFYTRNLKPEARRNASMLHIARLISAELYQAIPAGPPRTPM